MSHLATSHHKLSERVLDAYCCYVSDVPPTPKFFPDRETQDAKAIREAIQKEQETIQAFPGYAELLRAGLAPLQVAKYHLDYRTAGKLANLITEQHFKLQDGLEQEYKDDLRKHAPVESPEEILTRMSRRLKSIRWQKSRRAI